MGRMLESAELLDEIIAHFQPKLLAATRIADGRPDLRTDRSGARHHQSLVRQDRIRAGGGRRPRRAPTSPWWPDRPPLQHRVTCGRIDVRTAREMHDAVHAALPADIFIAVAAWRTGMW